MNDRVSAKYRERAETILDNDVQPIIQDAEKKRVGRVAKVWDQVQGLIEYVKDPDAPKAGKIVAVAALIYLVNPFDVVPDITPIAGLLDDAAFLVAAFTSVEADIRKRNEVARREREAALRRAQLEQSRMIEQKTRQRNIFVIGGAALLAAAGIIAYLVL